MPKPNRLDVNPGLWCEGPVYFSYWGECCSIVLLWSTKLETQNFTFPSARKWVENGWIFQCWVNLTFKNPCCERWQWQFSEDDGKPKRKSWIFGKQFCYHYWNVELLVLTHSVYWSVLVLQSPTVTVWFTVSKAHRGEFISTTLTAQSATTIIRHNVYKYEIGVQLFTPSRSALHRTPPSAHLRQTPALPCWAERMLKFWCGY